MSTSKWPALTLLGMLHNRQIEVALYFLLGVGTDFLFEAKFRTLAHSHPGSN